MTAQRVLITGANGFIGRATCIELTKRGMSVRAASRRHFDAPKGVENVLVDSISPESDWRSALVGCDVVIHLAARVHVIHDTAQDALGEFRKANVQGTLALAQQALSAGVRRFLYVSSIGVNGTETFKRPFKAADVPAPVSSYAISKYEAEMALRELTSETPMKLVIVRPPLVYGPNAPGNFGSLLRWLRRGIPLPFDAVDNKRSFVSLDNLVDFLLICVSHPAAEGQTFLVSDGEDISTTDLLRRVGLAMHTPVRLFRVPVAILRLAARLVGREDMVQRLCGSLQVDIGKNRQLLDWCPPITLDEGLKRAVLNV